MAFTSLKSVAYAVLDNDGGGGDKNWVEETMAMGAANCKWVKVAIRI
jgi:hypothetical protein